MRAISYLHLPSDFHSVKQHLLFWFLSAVLMCGCPVSALKAQGDVAYTRHDIDGDQLEVFSDITAVGSQDIYAVTTRGSGPLYLVDGAGLSATATFEQAPNGMGMHATASANGKYLLLEGLHLIEYKLSNREIPLRVVAVATGQTLLEMDGVNDAAFLGAGDELLVLSKGAVLRIALPSGKKETILEIPGASNCLAVHPDGIQVAVSHLPEEEFLENYLTRKGQRKNYKLYKKYRQCLSVYSLDTGKKLFTAQDMIDTPYKLLYDPTGAAMLCHSVPHLLLQSKSNQGDTQYLTRIDAADGATLAGGFVSNADTEPDVIFSPSGQYLALVTINGSRTPEAWIYTYPGAEIVARFTCDRRTLAGDAPDQKKGSAARLGLAFANGEKNLLLSYGSVLINWTIPYE